MGSAILEPKQCRFLKGRLRDPALSNRDWKRRLLAMGRAEARRVKLDWGTDQSWKRSLKKNGTLRGDALKRLKAALVGAG